jgi:peptide/nickel transport system permease protein
VQVEQDAGPTQLQAFVITLREHRAAWVSLWVLVALALACVVGPFLLPYAPTTQNLHLISAPPSSAHPAGTDKLGRDVLVRLLVAGRISLMIGFMVAIFSAAAGAAVGVAAGYFGGKVDAVLSWATNVLLTVPSLPLMIALNSVALSDTGPAAALLRSVVPEWRVIIVMSLLGWMGVSRVVRSQVITLRRQEFVEAATAMGASHTRISIVHILPNTVSVLSVFTTLAVSSAIMAEATLSFLGVGVQPPTATWGVMLSDGRDVFTALNYWWLTWLPACLILVTVLCVNFVGDGMRDAFDPRGRR